MTRHLSFIAVLLFALVGFSARVFGVERVRKIDGTLEEKYSIYYKCDSIDVNPTYLDNPEQIARIIHYIEKSPRIDSIVINAYASPEGGTKYNQWLSLERAKTAKRLLLSYSPDSLRLNSSKIKINPCGENWGGLTTSVLNSYNKSDRDQVLSILQDTTISDATRKTRLKSLDSGRTWRFLIDTYMPVLRAAEWVFVCAEVIPPLPSVKTELSAPVVAISGKKVSPSQVRTIPEVKEDTLKEHPFYMALETNLLYDAVAIPNIGAEFYLGKGFSAKVNWMYAWWKSDPIHWYWRTYGGDIGVNYWFGKAAKEKPLTGHHVGLYGQILTYDFELGYLGFMGGKPGGLLYDQPNYTVALEYGYSLPIAKRLNLDFSIGVGYHWGIFHEYVPIDNCYVWQATKRRQYFGPTKLDISLVWQIGKGNTNNRSKGGRR